VNGAGRSARAYPTPFGPSVIRVVIDAGADGA
jgi:hypothetical protein